MTWENMKIFEGFYRASGIPSNLSRELFEEFLMVSKWVLEF